MTKQLYFYNGICYDECPHGSIKNNKTFECDEINEYTSVNNSISIESFIQSNQQNILDYLSKYANNSVGITRINDFSNYFYNINTNSSFKVELNMPIFDFTECINKMKIKYKLYNVTNIFVGIREYNTQVLKDSKYNFNSNPVNSTSYQFFLENGTILNHSICLGMNIIVQKKVEMNKYNFDTLKELEIMLNKSIFNISKEFNDFCIPLSLNNKDLTLFDAKLLLNKNKKPCDENCFFQKFDFETSYSTCICPINDEKENIKDKIKEEFKENELFDKLYQLLDKGNFKYLKCFSRIYQKSIRQRHNWIIYLSILNIIVEIISIILYYKKHYQNILIEYDNNLKIKKCSKNNSQDKNTFVRIKTNNYSTRNSFTLKETSETISNEDFPKNKPPEKKLPKLFSIKNKSAKKVEIIDVQNDSINYSELNYPQTLIKDNRNFCSIFFEFVKTKILLGININNVGTIFYPLFLMILELNISLHTYFFINAILFSDKYISFRYSYNEKIGILFIIINEYDRILFVFIVSFFIIKIIRWLLDAHDGLNRADQFLHIKIIADLYLKEIETLKKIFKYKSIFSHILIAFLHLFYAYFILIFGNINSYTQTALFLSMIISLIIYFIICCFICLIISFLRVLSIKKKLEILFIISKFLYNLI